MSKVIEETTESDDRAQMLNTLAGGHPHLLITALHDPENPDFFTVKIDAGGGIEDLETVEALLRKAWQAIAPTVPTPGMLRVQED